MSEQENTPIQASAFETDNTAIEATQFKRSDATRKKGVDILRPVPILLTVLLLGLAMVAVFVFTARAVKFISNPDTASIEIVNGLVTYQLGERILMLPGSYTVSATAAGYHHLTEQIEVGTSPDQDIELVLRKLPGRLIANTEPDTRATVLIDQTAVGETPLEMDSIEPGLHDVQILAPRYLPYQTEIEIEGMREQQSLTASLSPAWADVSVSSNPDGASVLIDGEELGQTPGIIEVLQGEHTISIKKPGYKLWQSSLSVVPGEKRTLDAVTLVASDGKVAIETVPEGANVTIAERYRGQTPLSIALPPGDAYPILISKAGYEPVRRRLNVRAEEDLALSLSLKPVTGIVRLQVSPSDSELIVDGRVLSSDTRKLTLSATRHTVEARKPGYATFSTTVTPQPGLTQQLLITLQTEEEARAAAIPRVIAVMDDVTAQLIIPDRLSMGASRREPGRRSNEVQKQVQLTRAYYLGTHEITNKAFKQYDPSHESGILGRALLGDDERPVVNVAWQDIITFCNWLSARNGLPAAYEQVNGQWELIQPFNTGFRLPTEAEWAWAARYADGDTPTRFPWGDAMPPPSDAGNYADESAANMVPYHIQGYNDSFRGPAPIGSFPANPLGIHDLNGNVSEWVHDYYSVALHRKPLTDPTGPDTGDYHVIRGANYTHGRFSELRWTFRDYGQSGRPDVGFRIARYVE